MSGEAFIYLLEENTEIQKHTAEQIIQTLTQVKDPDNGKSVVARIYHKEELFQGRFFENMPDLIVIPEPGYSFPTYFQEHSELFHTVNPQDDFHLGMHHPDGILIATGKDIEAQSDIRTQIVNMTPTILYCLGIPFRKDSDGKVIESLFTSDFRRLHPVTKADLDGARSEFIDEKVYSEEDEQELRNRLENMGYL